jgi:hypothetical protein
VSRALCPVQTTLYTLAMSMLLVRGVMGRLASVLAKAVEDSGLPARRIAEDAKIAYSTLASYRVGRREPGEDVVHQVANALEKRADRIRRVADRMRRAAE